jgi:hypothetical protein
MLIAEMTDSLLLPPPPLLLPQTTNEDEHLDWEGRCCLVGAVWEWARRSSKLSS